MRLTEQARGLDHPLLARYLGRHAAMFDSQGFYAPLRQRYARRAVDAWEVARLEAGVASGAGGKRDGPPFPVGNL